MGDDTLHKEHPNRMRNAGFGLKKSNNDQLEKRVLVVGHTAKDTHIKIRNCENLPKEFHRIFKDSIPTSKVNTVLGKNWNFRTVLNLLKKNAITPISYSYGGRGANVAYGVAKLGAKVELTGFVGGDFNKVYKGFYDGGYLRHLRRGGVVISSLELNTGELDNVKDDISGYGLLVFTDKETATVYCIKDLMGNDFYFIDDVNGAHTQAERSPIPKPRVDRCDGVFVTSGEPSYNTRLIDYAYHHEKEVIFDVGAYNTTDDYLKEVIPKCDVILGNLYETDLVKKAFNCKSISELFSVSSHIKTIIVEDKIACEAEVYQQEGQNKIRVGPVNVEKRVSSTGCCDGIAAGYLAFHLQDYDLATCVQAGLIQCASIWQTEGVQEGMLNRPQLLQRLSKMTSRHLVDS